MPDWPPYQRAGIARESWLGHAKGRPDEDAYCRPCRLLLETYDRL